MDKRTSIHYRRTRPAFGSYAATMVTAIRGASNASVATDAKAALAPAIRWQSAIITEIIARTPRIKSFLLRLSQPLVWTAGQHVDIRLTAPSGYRAMRSYSIAGAREPDAIELAIEYLRDGEVSAFFP